MGMSVLTNTASLNAQRHLNRTQDELNASMSRLSSGLRINKAADDAAGLAISEKLRSQIRGLGQAERNAMDAISLIQTAEGAMNEVSAIFTRMRELAVQSANGTLGTSERNFIQLEFNALRQEVDRIAEVTEFNGANLLDGSTTGLTFQVGLNDNVNDRISVAFVDVHASQLGTSGTQIDDLSLSTVSGSRAAMGVLDEAIQDMSSARAVFGSAQNRLTTTITNLATARENLSAANSRIRDTDIAEETANLTRANILAQAGISVLSQANQLPSQALSLLGG